MDVWRRSRHHRLIIANRSPEINLLLRRKLFNLINDWISSAIELLRIGFINSWRQVILLFSWLRINKTSIVILHLRTALFLIIMTIEGITLVVLQVLIKLSTLTLKSRYTAIYHAASTWRHSWWRWHVVIKAAPASGTTHVGWIRAPSMSTTNFLIVLTYYTVSDLLSNKLMPLKPVKQREFLEAISWVLKHDNFITHSSKFNSITYSQLISVILFELMIFVPAHKSHYKP